MCSHCAPHKTGVPGRIAHRENVSGIFMFLISFVLQNVQAKAVCLCTDE